MNTNDLIDNGFIFTPDPNLDNCAICGRRHITPGKEMMNATFNSRPIPGYCEGPAADAVAAAQVSPEIRETLSSLVRPNALRKFEAAAEILKIHATGAISYEDTFAIIRSIDA